jgi:glucokinase
MRTSSATHSGRQPPFWAIGVDVGGTKIAAGLVRFPKGEVYLRRQIPTEADRGGNAVLQEVLRLCEKLMAEAQRQREHVSGIGIGVCELVDLAGNVFSENCVAWKGVPVRVRLSRLAPTVLEADVRAAGLAEALFGAGKLFKEFLYVTVGTGISCCLMLDGKPFTGARGATGTMASSPLNMACGQCGYVNQRSLEDLASGPALVTRYNQLCSANAVSGEAVQAAAAAGDAVAARVVSSGGEALGATIGLLVNVLDPEAIVVGGGLGSSEGLFWENLVASARRHIWSEAHRNLPISRALTGPDAGLIGAAAAVWKSAA